eukprot:m.28234 g.28234  ORF g.28234 m.28234 type:complete len:189 (-) comp8786_c0_seq1:303-869(-)
MTKFPTLDFEVKWRPFFLSRDQPRRVGVNKLEHYNKKFGTERVQAMVPRMTQVFADLGINYSMGGETGNTMDSHRLLTLAAKQGKQDALAEAMFRAYFSEEKFLGDHDVLKGLAGEVGVEGATELLADDNALVQEVEDDLRKWAGNVRGVPYFYIGDSLKLSGAQSADVFVEAIQEVCELQGIDVEPQ